MLRALRGLIELKPSLLARNLAPKQYRIEVGNGGHGMAPCLRTEGWLRDIDALMSLAGPPILGNLFWERHDHVFRDIDAFISHAPNLGDGFFTQRHTPHPRQGRCTGPFSPQLLPPLGTVCNAVLAGPEGRGGQGGGEGPRGGGGL